MNEFKLIAQYFAPLAKQDKSALDLKDDAAVITIPSGHELVITKDAIVEDVHFMKGTSPDVIARKLLRVNLSDMAAMGATPYGYLLALMLPGDTDEAWLKAFAEGLKADQKYFGITLLGGDTTRTEGSLALSATMLGYVPHGNALKRAGARPSDDVYVSGTIGDGALGLKYPGDRYVLTRYQLPEPRVKLGEKLRGIANACMDISDGLVQDLGHLCDASRVGAILRYAEVPVSAAAQSILKDIENPYEMILAGGDDYELLFTASPDSAESIQALAEDLDVIITRVGSITEKVGVRVVDESGKEILLSRTGYTHF